MPPAPVVTSFDGYEIWFVTGSQTLYGEETLRQVAEQSRQVVEGLSDQPVRAVWRPAPDFPTSSACWLAAGAAHHTVMTTAVGVEVFRDFAEMSGTELLVIDETTSVREFQRELRWNQAYYRLAAGV